METTHWEGKGLRDEKLWDSSALEEGRLVSYIRANTIAENMSTHAFHFVPCPSPQLAEKLNEW